MTDGALSYVKGQPLAMVRTGVADTNYTVTSGDYIVGYTALTASRTVTLPASPVAGRRLVIKDEAGNCSASNKIIINATVDGSSPLQLATPYAFCELYANGTNWSKIISG